MNRESFKHFFSENRLFLDLDKWTQSA